jgi:hypothetical protein
MQIKTIKEMLQRLAENPADTPLRVFDTKTKRTYVIAGVTMLYGDDGTLAVIEIDLPEGWVQLEDDEDSRPGLRVVKGD